MLKKNILLIFLILTITSSSGALDYGELLDAAFDLYKKEEKQKALDLINQAILLQPSLPDGYIIRGIILYKGFNKSLDAGLSFRKGIELTTHPESRKKNIELINEITSRTISSEEEENYKQGFRFVGENNPTEAIPFLEKAILLNPENYRNYYEIGYAYIDLKNNDKAMYYLEKAREINPVNLPLLKELKYLYAEMGNFDKARNVLSDLLSIYGESPFLYQELGFLYFRTGNPDLAILTLQTSLKKFPDYALTHYSLGDAFFHEKKCDLVVYHLTKFLDEISPDTIKKYNIRVDTSKLKVDAEKMISACKNTGIVSQN